MKKYLIFIVLIFLGCRSSILDDPTTTISFHVDEDSYVLLYVENSYNTRVATLVDEELPAGRYRVQFSADDLAEGMYFYFFKSKNLRTNEVYKINRELVLVK